MISSRTLKLSLFLTFTASICEAQMPYMLSDLLPDNVEEGALGTIFLGSEGSSVFFSEAVDSLGEELWVTQGTPESTHLVSDLCPGSCSSHPRTLGVAGGRFYFSARPDENYSGASVYSVLPSGLDLQLVAAESDGYRLGFLNQDESSGYFAEVAGQAQFIVVTLDGGEALLRSSGSQSETAMIFDFGDPSDQRFPYGLTEIGDSRAIFFYAAGFVGVVDEVWVTDGTTAGTRSIAELGERASPGDPQTSGSRVYFQSSSETGSVLWISDGTSEGTTDLTNFADPTSQILGLESGSPVAYFLVTSATSGEELWATNGSRAGTHAATSFGYHEPFDSPSPQEFRSRTAIVDGHAYFIASDGIHPRQLWKTDGTPASNRAIGELCTEYDCGDSWVESVGGRALFAGASESGIEPMVAGMSGDSVSILEDICPGPCSSSPTRAQALPSGRVLFVTDNPDSSGSSALWLTGGAPSSTWNLLSPALQQPSITNATPYALESDTSIYFIGLTFPGGFRLWVSPGSPASATVFADLQGVTRGGSPRLFEASTSDLYFVANGYSSPIVGRVSGSSGSVELISGSYYICGTSDNAQPTSLGDSLIFFGCRSDSIYRVDPAATEAILVKNLEVGRIEAAVGLASRVVLVVSTEPGWEVWKTDGTSTGTVKGFSLPPESEFGDHAWAINGKAVLTAYLSGSGLGLYAIGPQVSSLELLTALSPSFYGLFETSNGLGFFSKIEGEIARLWRTDATAAGTIPLLTLPSTAALLGASRWGSEYLLLVRINEAQVELIRTDGSLDGTSVVTQFAPAASPGTVDMADFEGRVYFVFPLGERTAIWTTDGTASGTEAVWTAPNGASADLETELEASASGLLFTAADPDHGTEPWIIEHTGSSPRLLQDISPGPTSSYPSSLFRHGDSVYFSASDSVHGQELWVLPPSGGPPCQSSDKALCLEGGRFRVEAYWRDFAWQLRRRDCRTDLGRHRLLLVLRRRERRDDPEAHRRHRLQRAPLGLLRRALECRIHLHGHRLRDRRGQALLQSGRTLRELGRHHGLRPPGGARERRPGGGDDPCRDAAGDLPRRLLGAAGAAGRLCTLAHPFLHPQQPLLASRPPGAISLATPARPTPARSPATPATSGSSTRPTSKSS